MGDVSRSMMSATEVPIQGSAEPILEIKNLSVTFKRESSLSGKSRLVRAVNDVSFVVPEGEVVAIVGESGSGKTTIARCILGLTEVNSGSIVFNGQDISKLKGKAAKLYRRDVQIVYQDPYESLNPRLDIFTTVAMPIRYLTRERNRKKLEDRVSSLLKEVDLDPTLVMKKYPHQLSGGERQRVNIARALASDPRVLVADEPITMLDAAQRLNVLGLLMELKRKRNLTILVITHDLASAKLISHRIFIMYLGRVVEYGLTSEVLSRREHPYVKLLEDSIPKIEFREEKIIEFPEAQEAPTRGCVFSPRCVYATAICKEQEPPLTSKADPQHFSACFNPLMSSSSDGKGKK